MRSASDNLCLEPISCSELYAHKLFRNHKLFLEQHLPSHEKPLKIMVMGTQIPQFHVLRSSVATRMWVHCARLSGANVNCPSCAERNITVPFSHQWSIACVFLEKQSFSVCCCSWHISLETGKHLIVCITSSRHTLKRWLKKRFWGASESFYSNKHCKCFFLSFASACFSLTHVNLCSISKHPNTLQL